MATKNETRDAVIIWLFSEFLFHLFSFAFWRMFLLKLVSAFHFFLLIAILIFLSATTNSQTKCGIIYEKIAMQAGDDERMYVCM